MLPHQLLKVDFGDFSNLTWNNFGKQANETKIEHVCVLYVVIKAEKLYLIHSALD